MSFKKGIEGIVGLYYKLLFKIEVKGIENYISDGGAVVCANHINAQDPLVIGTNLPGYMMAMAKRELFSNKLFNWFFVKMGGIPVDRDGNDLAALKSAIRSVKGGNQLLIFAEGTRNKGKEPLEVKPGAAMIAHRGGVPIIPVTIDSNWKLFSKVIVTVHPPVYTKDILEKKPSTEEYQDLLQGIMKQIYSIMELH